MIRVRTAEGPVYFIDGSRVMRQSGDGLQRSMDGAWRPILAHTQAVPSAPLLIVFEPDGLGDLPAGECELVAPVLVTTPVVQVREV